MKDEFLKCEDCGDELVDNEAVSLNPVLCRACFNDREEIRDN